jgi:quercetin dioxygenase-like cupin family protein
MKTQPAFDEFATAARARGFDEVVERKWAPSLVLDTHTHAFAVEALVVQGEMWLTVGDQVRHLKPGDEFALEREAPHAERYGPEGATYWAARRNR